MLRPTQRSANLLGTILVAGSIAGVVLSAGAVLALAMLGADTRSWPLSLGGWWTGEHALLRFSAGLGIVLLAATPVTTLVLFGIQALREGHGRTILTVVGLLMIIISAVCLNLLGVRSA